MTHDEIYEGRVAGDERNYSSNTSNYRKTPNPIVSHDELLARIDADIKFVNDTFYRPNTGMLEIRDLMVSSLLALRAVVGLHNQSNTGDCGDEGCCGGYTPDICSYCHDKYPCPTIQAIEKEMK